MAINILQEMEFKHKALTDACQWLTPNVKQSACVVDSPRFVALRPLGRVAVEEKWALRDSNPRPTACKAVALAN